MSLGPEFLDNSEKLPNLKEAEEELVGLLVQSPVIQHLHWAYEQVRADDYMAEESESTDLETFVRAYVENIGTEHFLSRDINPRIQKILNSDLSIAHYYEDGGVEFSHDQERMKRVQVLIDKIKKIKTEG